MVAQVQLPMQIDTVVRIDYWDGHVPHNVPSMCWHKDFLLEMWWRHDAHADVHMLLAQAARVAAARWRRSLTAAISALSEKGFVEHIS